MAPARADVDRANESFWEELCGSKLAREHGITDSSPSSVARFDRVYLDFYPYLTGYVPDPIAGKRVLEIGLGYGTLGQWIAERGADYNALDIAAGPVEMMRERIRRVGLDEPERRVVQGSALAIPHDDASLDHVVSIGCLHHTGDLRGAMAEVHRVLRPGGSAVVMVYAKHSFRRYALIAAKAPYLLRGGQAAVEREVRRVYDRTLAGEAAPAIEFSSRRELRRMLEDFGRVSFRRENFDDVKLLKRDLFLNNLARVAGVDHYVTAVK